MASGFIRRKLGNIFKIQGCCLIGTILWILLNMGSVHIEPSILGEELQGINSSSLLYINYGDSSRIRVGPIHVLEESSVAVTYTYEPPPRFGVRFLNSSSYKNKSPGKMSTNLKVEDLYRVFSRPNGRCPKLHRFGGHLTCGRVRKIQAVMDGQKYICLDPELQVITGSPEPQDCLVLSFGVNWDISFDVAAREANCKVLMFDPDPYYHPIIQAMDHIEIFTVGLDMEERREYITSLNRTRYFSTFTNLASKYNFTNKLINVLKMDIEGDEWKILRDIVTQPYLDTIGQIAIEIHGLGIEETSYKNEEQRETAFAAVREIFTNLEDKGFRIISYFGNVISARILFENKNGWFFSVGEILLVNTRWYNGNLRNKARSEGFNFRDLS